MSDWIDCRERMPENTGLRWSRAVNVWCPDRKNTYTACLEHDTGAWSIFGATVYSVHEKVTHWMPIPAPPEPRKEG